MFERPPRSRRPNNRAGKGGGKQVGWREGGGGYFKLCYRRGDGDGTAVSLRSCQYYHACVRCGPPEGRHTSHQFMSAVCIRRKYTRYCAWNLWWLGTSILHCDKSVDLFAGVPWGCRRLRQPFDGHCRLGSYPPCHKPVTHSLHLRPSMSAYKASLTNPRDNRTHSRTSKPKRVQSET